MLARIAKHAPVFLAFNGVKAARETLGVIDGYGPEILRAADVHTWVLPSTSVAASGFWDIHVWRALAAAIDRGLSPRTSRPNLGRRLTSRSLRWTLGSEGSMEPLLTRHRDVCRDARCGLHGARRSGAALASLFVDSSQLLLLGPSLGWL